MEVVVFGPGEGEVFGPLRILAQSPDHPIGFTEQMVPPGSRARYGTGTPGCTTSSTCSTAR